MRRQLVGVCLLVGLALAPSALGQSRGIVGADGALNFPVGNFADMTGIGFGALGRYEYSLLPQLNLTARTGMILSVGTTRKVFGQMTQDYAFHIFPIWGGARYFVWETAYAALELGLNVLIAAGDLPSAETAAKFGLNLGGGYQINDLDLRLGLQMYDVPHAGDTFALMFSLGYTFLQL
jgi:hypothetical protein